MSTYGKKQFHIRKTDTKTYCGLSIYWQIETVHHKESTCKHCLKSFNGAWNLEKKKLPVEYKRKKWEQWAEKYKLESHRVKNV